MPVDLAKDLHKLKETVAWVPGLRTVCSRTTSIVEKAQIAERNILRLQNLAHSVTEHVVSLEKRMRGRWDNAPVKLDEYISHFEAILQDVLSIIQKYSQLSREAAIRSATDRDTDITTVEERLRDIQKAISTLPGMNTILTVNRPKSRTSSYYRLGLGVNRPQTVLDSHHRLGLVIDRPQTAVRSRLPRVETQTGPSFLRRKHGGDVSVLVPVVNDADDNEPPETFPEPKSDTSIELSDRINRLYSGRVASPLGSETSTSRTFFGRRLMPNAAPDLTGRIAVVERRRYSGGFGDIFPGEFTGKRGTEPVAVKTLRVVSSDKKMVKIEKKFRREVRLWCSIRHRHVLPFYGTCEYDGSRLCMVSPWAQGGSSLEYLRRHPSTNRSRLLWQAASALEYLHSGKDVPPIVHGDLKAENVLISAEGNVLLCDFGLSRCVGELGSPSGSSSEGRVGGTARFMAPELLITPKNVPKISRPTPESDIFAFASLMLQIYTESVPFNGVPEVEALLRLAYGELPARPVEPTIVQRGLNDRMWSLMTECWTFKPGKRPKMAVVQWRIVWADERAASQD